MSCNVYLSTDRTEHRYLWLLTLTTDYKICLRHIKCWLHSFHKPTSASQSTTPTPAPPVSWQYTTLLKPSATSAYALPLGTYIAEAKLIMVNRHTVNNNMKNAVTQNSMPRLNLQSHFTQLFFTSGYNRLVVSQP